MYNTGYGTEDDNVSIVNTARGADQMYSLSFIPTPYQNYGSAAVPPSGGAAPPFVENCFSPTGAPIIAGPGGSSASASGANSDTAPFHDAQSFNGAALHLNGGPYGGGGAPSVDEREEPADMMNAALDFYQMTLYRPAPVEVYTIRAATGGGIMGLGGSSAPVIQQFGGR